MNSDGNETELELIRERVATDPHIVGADQPKLGTFVVLAIPALLYFPAELVAEAAVPLSALRRVAQMVVLLVFLTPLTVVPMLVMAWRYTAPRKARYLAWLLTLVTAGMALMCIPVLSFFLGIA